MLRQQYECVVVDLDQESDSLDHAFFSTPISRSTALTTEVQRLLGFINIKADLELYLIINKQRQRRHIQHGSHETDVTMKYADL